MARIRCPRCGTRFHTAQPDVELTPRQIEILHLIPQVARRTKRTTAPTAAIATELNLHPRTVRLELKTLEQLNEVTRPEGPKSGYAVVEQHGVELQVVGRKTA